jgi:hypothetical protein
MLRRICDFIIATGYNSGGTIHYRPGEENRAADAGA